MRIRGSYAFEIDSSGALLDSAANVEKLRALFRDGDIIDQKWGPGDAGDFDNGSWHIACHLVAGAGAWDTPSGRLWSGITHVASTDTYEATLVSRRGGRVTALPLNGSDSREALAHATCIGFIEGSSLGHISARGVRDAPTAFNGWPRQQFDQEVSSQSDGGTVWEHWSTTRDIRSSSALGTSVLAAYLTLVFNLGGRYVAALARGRREHDHPRQLVSLVRAGVLAAEDALWDVAPDPIPPAAESLLYEARPAEALAAAESLAFTAGHQRYFMFQRRIDRWSRTEDVRGDLHH
jgi:hypothetical protein